MNRRRRVGLGLGGIECDEAETLLPACESGSSAESADSASSVTDNSATVRGLAQE